VRFADLRYGSMAQHYWLIARLDEVAQISVVIAYRQRSVVSSQRHRSIVTRTSVMGVG